MCFQWAPWQPPWCLSLGHVPVPSTGTPRAGSAPVSPTALPLSKGSVRRRRFQTRDKGRQQGFISWQGRWRCLRLVWSPSVLGTAWGRAGPWGHISWAARPASSHPTALPSPAKFLS